MVKVMEHLPNNNSITLISQQLAPLSAISAEQIWIYASSTCVADAHRFDETMPRKEASVEVAGVEAITSLFC